MLHSHFWAFKTRLFKQSMDELTLPAKYAPKRNALFVELAIPYSAYFEWPLGNCNFSDSIVITLATILMCKHSKCPLNVPTTYSNGLRRVMPVEKF